MEFAIDFSKEEDKMHLYSVLKKLNSEYMVYLKKGKTSIQQIRYYRGVVLKIIAEETGEDAQALHEQLLSMFSLEMYLFKGKEHWKVKRTNDMSRVEFSTYIESIRRWAASFDIIIPDAEIVRDLTRD